MPQPPDWKRVLETGMQFTEMRRSQAYRIASDLVAQGQLARDQIGAAVDELVEMSRRRSEELRTIVRDEVQRQLGVLGLATKRDLDLLERKLRAVTGGRVAKSATTPAAKRAPAKKKAAAKKSAAKVPAKKKAAAKKAGKKRAATKTAAKKTARKAPAKKTAARSATRRTGTRKAVRKPAAKRAR